MIRRASGSWKRFIRSSETWGPRSTVDMGGVILPDGPPGEVLESRAQPDERNGRMARPRPGPEARTRAFRRLRGRHVASTGARINVANRQHAPVAQVDRAAVS